MLIKLLSLNSDVQVGIRFTIAGQAHNIDKDSHTFMIDAQQYHAEYKGTRLIRALCSFPNTQRWSSAKPLPLDDAFVTVTGYAYSYQLEECPEDVEEEAFFPKVLYVQVDIGNMVFQGRPTNQNAILASCTSIGHLLL